MKTYIFLLISLICFSCNSLKNFEQTPICPEGYDCETDLIKNTSINILEDTIGKNYVSLEDNDAFHTLKYSYGYKSSPQLADANYQEVIYFQFPVDAEKMQLTRKEVEIANFIIAKHCFCPDAGYEVINDGNINVVKNKNKYYVTLDFQSDKKMRVGNIKTIVGL